LGALRRSNERGHAFYAADEAHASWRAWIILLRACAAPVDVLREALVDASGLEAAFVFGSVARNDTGPGSDVDVLLVGGDEAREQAGRVLSDASLLIGKDLDVVGYAPDELRERLRSGNAFIQRVLQGPKEWLRGPDTADWAVPA
jgi:predicted nucleotidyltransferase